MESAEFPELGVSEAFDTPLILSSFSELLSTSIGSSLSSFPDTPFVPSEASVVADFLVLASPDAPSNIPLAFVEESLEDAETNIQPNVLNEWYFPSIVVN